MPRPLARLSVAAALTTLALGATACSSPAEEAPEDANVNGGAERSFTDEELKSHTGGSYFPGTFPYEELMEDHKCQPGTAAEGGFTPGAYVIGGEDAPSAGTYELTGSQVKPGELYVYAPSEEEPGKYESKYALSYFGFTLVELNAGDAVFFTPPEQTNLITTMPATPIDATAPYESGLYRVGVDIPAGAYTVTQEEQSAAAIAEKAFTSPQAIVYDSLDFALNENVSEEFLPELAEGPVSVVVTVEDGQYLELYGCTATPLAES